VEAIAASLGYQDAANFRRAFRNWEQCSPQAYRHKARKDRDCRDSVEAR
jgi:AraC-like DNA-binding protein